jgi:hypothetical protein
MFTCDFPSLNFSDVTSAHFSPDFGTVSFLEISRILPLTFIKVMFNEEAQHFIIHHPEWDTVRMKEVPLMRKHSKKS